MLTENEFSSKKRRLNLNEIGVHYWYDQVHGQSSLNHAGLQGTIFMVNTVDSNEFYRDIRMKSKTNSWPLHFKNN